MSYKLDQQLMVGESYVRCNQVIIDNKLGKAPAVNFAQETIVATGNGKCLHVPMGALHMSFDLAAKIPVINPQTGEPTGDIVTQAEVHTLIYSAYIACVNAAAEADDTLEGEV